MIKRDIQPVNFMRLINKVNIRRTCYKFFYVKILTGFKACMPVASLQVAKVSELS